MSVVAPGTHTDNLESQIMDKDPESELENKCDSEKYEQLSESELLESQSQVEKESRPDADFQQGDHMPEDQRDEGKSDKAGVKTESEDSELESDRSQAGSEVYDRLADIQITGCGDGETESNMPAFDDLSKKSFLRRRLGEDLGSTVAKEAANDNRESALDEKANFIKGDSLFDSDMKVGEAPANAAMVRNWVKYIAPKTMCLLILSLIYLGFTVFGIKVLRSSSPDST